MDAFFPNYCSVCDKTLHDFNDLYCSDACRLHDSSPRLTRNLVGKQKPLSLQYPSVLLQQYQSHRYPRVSHFHPEHEHSDRHNFGNDLDNDLQTTTLNHSHIHRHSHACHIAHRQATPPSLAPELSISDDEDDLSIYSFTDIPALSLDSREALSL